MSTAIHVESRIGNIEVTDEAIIAHLVDGRVISVPLAWSWRLSDANATQRANWQLIGDGHGVLWPDVDEDISAEGMLSGIPAHRSRSRRPSTTPANRPLQPTSGGMKRSRHECNRRSRLRGKALASLSEVRPPMAIKCLVEGALFRSTKQRPLCQQAWMMPDRRTSGLGSFGLSCGSPRPPW